MKDIIITPKKLKRWGPCPDGMKWGLSVVGEGMSLATALPKFERADWMLWTLGHCDALTKPQYVALTIICAKTVLHIFEKKCPKDKRPRKAIEATIKYAWNPTKVNKNAYDCAAHAADAAYAATAYAAAYAAAAAHAAYASAAHADVAAYAATYAAHAAYAATAHADVAAYAATAYAASVTGAHAYPSAAAKRKHHKKMCGLILNKIRGWGLI